MRRSGLTPISIGFLLMSVCILSLTSFNTPAQETPSEGQTPSITIEGASVVWQAKLQPSEGLAKATADTAPRISLERAATVWETGLEPSDELINAASQVGPRIFMEHAATTSLIVGLAGSSDLDEATSKVTPRILIEHAETTQYYALSPLQPIPSPDENGIPVWWIILGLVAAAALVIALVKAP